jgi:hypothetical protein
LNTLGRRGGYLSEPSLGLDLSDSCSNLEAQDELLANLLAALHYKIIKGRKDLDLD